MKLRPLLQLGRLPGLAGLLILLFTISHGLTRADANAPEFVSFFSNHTTFNDKPVPVGAVIKAFDPQGVKCGESVVTTEGQFGLLPCQRDDPDTPEDEGPEPGERVFFKIDDVHAVATPISLNFSPVPPGTVITWSGFGHIWEINLSAVAPATPVLPTPTPMPAAVRSVGGYGEPLSALELLAPWIVLVVGGVICVVGTVAFRKRIAS